MKDRNIFGIVLSVIFLILVVGSSLARETGAKASPDNSDTAAWNVANAPWFSFAIDEVGDRGQYAGININPQNDDTVISYYDSTREYLMIAYDRSTGGNCGPDNGWACARRDSASSTIGRYNSIAFDPIAGDVGIAFHEATYGKLKYLDPSPGYGWITLTIDEGIYPVSYAGLYTSLQYRADGAPYIAYQFSIPGVADFLMLTYYVGSNGNCGLGVAKEKWQCDTIVAGDGVGQYASLALDGAGYKHIAYYDGGNGDLWYATSTTGANCGPGNSWSCYRVSGSSGNVGKYASMYVDSDSHFHIAYYNATTENLEYAVDVDSGGNCALGTAQCDVIDAMPADYHPLGISIAEDAAGYPIIAYQSGNGSLNVARPVSALGLSGGGGNCGPDIPFSSWYCQTIDRAGKWNPYRNGDFVSIDVNSAGLATIAYYGFITSSGGNLLVASQRLQVFQPLILK